MTFTYVAKQERENSSEIGTLIESHDVNEELDQSVDSRLLSVIVLCSAATTGALGAIPIVAVLIVQSIGFSISGITAGSTASAMMSAEAIAAGGAVASGGAVSSLQSIGAIGMGGALQITGIVILSLSVAVAVIYGVYECVKVFTQCSGDSTKVNLESFPFRKIAIKAPNGLYLRALGGGKGNWFFDWRSVACYTGIIKAEALSVSRWETFVVHPCDKGYFALQSHHGGFLCAEKKRGVTDVIAGDWEKFRFTLIREDEGSSSTRKGFFQTHNNLYLTINHMHCHFTANTKKKHRTAIFEVINID
jgi:hypothetical protein